MLTIYSSLFWGKGILINSSFLRKSYNTTVELSVIKQVLKLITQEQPLLSFVMNTEYSNILFIFTVFM